MYVAVAYNFCTIHGDPSKSKVQNEPKEGTSPHKRPGLVCGEIQLVAIPCSDSICGFVALLFLCGMQVSVAFLIAVSRSGSVFFVTSVCLCAYVDATNK